MIASRVSVVIPCFNGARYLGEAIDSALAQTHPDVEVIVVDDGSTDGTPAVVSGYGDRLRCVRQPNRGLAGARNAGIRHARGPYVAFLDHDDRFLPDKLARQAAVLDARPDAGLVYCGWHFIDADGARLPPTGWDVREGDVTVDLLRGNIMHPATVVVRRTALDAAGGFDEGRTGLEDWDLWLRMAVRGVRWACVDAPLLEYRVHPGQMHRHGADRRLRNALVIFDRVFADPALPAHLRSLEGVARQNVYFAAAAHHYRSGEAAAGRAAFRAGMEARPATLADHRALLRFARLLFPTGAQGQTALATHWRSVAGTLRDAVGGVFDPPRPAPVVARLRWPARIAVLRATMRLARKRAQLQAGWRPRRRREQVEALNVDGTASSS